MKVVWCIACLWSLRFASLLRLSLIFISVDTLHYVEIKHKNESHPVLPKTNLCLAASLMKQISSLPELVIIHVDPTAGASWEYFLVSNTSEVGLAREGLP